MSHLGTPAPADGGVQQVQRLLDGRTILAYTTDVAGTKRFARALRGTLERSLRIALTGPPAPDAVQSRWPSVAQDHPNPALSPQRRVHGPRARQATRRPPEGLVWRWIRWAWVPQRRRYRR